MLHLFSDLRSLSLSAEGDTFGSVEDLFFDDRHWRARYVVADVGGWLTGRRALIAASLCGDPDLVSRILPVAVDRETVENAPEPQADPPVSQQHSGLSLTSTLPMFALAPPIAGYTPLMAEAHLTALSDRAEAGENAGDPHLRSANEVLGYSVHATDGTFGSVDDIVLGAVDWKIAYFVIDTGDWLPGRRVIVGGNCIDEISWAERQIHVPLSRHEVGNGPDLRDLPGLQGDALDQMQQKVGYVAV